MTPILRRVAAPLRVAVRGRDGVGRTTVAAALTASGVELSAGAADIDVVVIAEALKPEDRALIGKDRPTVLMLNKADLTGFGRGGPLASAHRLAAECRALTGVPTVPMVGLLAVAELDDELVAALRTLVGMPADLTSTDAFVECPHPLPREVRRRLLDTLDRFGVAHAVLAVGSGTTSRALTDHLRRLSLVDGAVRHLDAAGAPIRYRRVQTALAQLRTLAAQSADDRLADFLSADATVLAVMSAAVDVVEAAGVHVDRGDDATAHLRRAVHWTRYGRGPVDALHRHCAADISRGSLRLLGRAT
ncbi:hypothetical protein [Mycobacterium deserti]|uniref:Uncharacterized protein n=1 Tax=Mycobacterium deserti TaxID=2978347 RepID=A0ABT2MBG4_9MYCO|nr:hypothetical protein [Mycobacterium deserti]MCT7658899.1 hypothetical protein [Mycobacterium deserti]